MIFSYRDTLILDPIDVAPYAKIEDLDDRIRQHGFIHGHKSNDSVEFQVEAHNLWDLRGKMEQLVRDIEDLVTYELNDDCVYGSLVRDS